jgi:hypothetical protein
MQAARARIVCVVSVLVAALDQTADLPRFSFATLIGKLPTESFTAATRKAGDATHLLLSNHGLRASVVASALRADGLTGVAAYR